MSPKLSNRFDQPLHIELRASRVLPAVTAILYLLSAYLWLQVPLPHEYLAALYAGLLGHFVWLVCLQFAGWTPASINRLGWDRRRGWWLRRVDGRMLEASLCMPVFVSRHLVAVRFRTGRRRSRSVLVVSDRLDSEAFRRLRVRLIQSSRSNDT